MYRVSLLADCDEAFADEFVIRREDNEIEAVRLIPSALNGVLLPTSRQ